MSEEPFGAPIASSSSVGLRSEGSHRDSGLYRSIDQESRLFIELKLQFSKQPGLYISEILCLSSWLRSVHCYSAALFSRGVCRLGFASGCTTPGVRTAAYSCIASSLRRMLMRRCISLSAYLGIGRWLNCNELNIPQLIFYKVVDSCIISRVYINAESLQGGT